MPEDNLQDEILQDQEPDKESIKDELKDDKEKESKSDEKKESKEDLKDEPDKGAEKDKEKGSEKKKEEPNSKTDKTDEKVDPEIGKLQTALEGKDTEISTLTQELDSSKEEITKHVARTEELEKVIAGFVESKVESVPEAYKELMPEGDPLKQLEWIKKAEDKGLFNKEKEKPEVEIGKNMLLDKKGTQTAKDEITSHQRLSNYFSKAFSPK